MQPANTCKHKLTTPIPIPAALIGSMARDVVDRAPIRVSDSINGGYVEYSSKRALQGLITAKLKGLCTIDVLEDRIRKQKLV